MLSEFAMCFEGMPSLVSTRSSDAEANTADFKTTFNDVCDFFRCNRFYFNSEYVSSLLQGKSHITFNGKQIFFSDAQLLVHAAGDTWTAFLLATEMLHLAQKFCLASDRLRNEIVMNLANDVAKEKSVPVTEEGSCLAMCAYLYASIGWRECLNAYAPLARLLPAGKGIAAEIRMVDFLVRRAGSLRNFRVEGTFATLTDNYESSLRITSATSTTSPIIIDPKEKWGISIALKNKYPKHWEQIQKSGNRYYGAYFDHNTFKTYVDNVTAQLTDIADMDDDPVIGDYIGRYITLLDNVWKLSCEMSPSNWSRTYHMNPPEPLRIERLGVKSDESSQVKLEWSSDPITAYIQGMLLVRDIQYFYVKQGCFTSDKRSSIKDQFFERVDFVECKKVEEGNINVRRAKKLDSNIQEASGNMLDSLCTLDAMSTQRHKQQLERLKKQRKAFPPRRKLQLQVNELEKARKVRLDKVRFIEMDELRGYECWNSRHTARK
ncbi:MAG: hypothetical protein LBQ43_03045 [Holosporales bacterium]|jgi:hypothetical protein|nr:hypothetical protein [Holosporales bacterium]